MVEGIGVKGSLVSWGLEAGEASLTTMIDCGDVEDAVLLE